jgi:ADP-ribose pyrophosphatase YjhB (NUDIX family)
LGESAEEAAVREVREELGVAVEIGKLFTVVSDVELDELGRVKYHFVIIDFLARLLEEGIRLNEESSEFGWFNYAEVQRLEMNPKTRTVVMECLRTVFE